MDNFIEFMVKKKMEIVDIFHIIGVFLIGVLIMLLALIFIRYTLPFLFVILAAVIWGICIFVSFKHIEFEYEITNADLDIDKIMGKRKRKRVISVNLRQIEMYSDKHNHNFQKYLENKQVKKVFACTSVKDEVSFIILNEESTEKMIVFNPNEKMIDAIKRIAPNKCM